MENKINIAELLKDCPRGMELDCTMYEDVYFDYVDELNIIHCYIQYGTHKTSLTFNQHGTPNSDIKSKCVIFPKGKTTWEEFELPYKFKDGDIVTWKDGGGSLVACIYKERLDISFSHHIALYKGGLGIIVNGEIVSTNDELCIATEEEKAKLFKAIKDNGYHWNADTKTLENLVEPWTIQYAKDGDVLAFDDETIVIFKDLYNNTSFHSYCHIEDGIFTISKEDMPDWWQVKGFYPATEEQCTLLFRKIKEAGYHWNAETKTLEKLPKFKVGDIIQDITGICKVKITEVNVEDKCYLYKSLNINGIGFITFNRQDDWELVPTKFDITTLKPFKSEVLVRNYKSDYWKPAIFGFTEKDKNDPSYVVVGGNFYYKCIPYEGNEHLLGTTDDCDDYYKL